MPRRTAAWTPRPVQSMLLRTFIIVAPLAVGLAVTWGLTTVIPRPTGPTLVGWWAGISLAALAALFVAERAVRRLSPLAVLLRLSLAFPDRAPSRLRVARKSGNLRRLRDQLERARRRGEETDLTRAAENILALAAALSAHDRRTRGHSERVRVFTDMLAAELRVPEPARQRLRWAALLHDIGKLRVPAKILNKEQALDPHEWSLIHRHPEEGLAIAEPLVPWLGEAATAIRQHHERFDGGGYPVGLAGREITRGARIVSVADAFETMTAGRPYQRPLSPGAARLELARNAGSQFDPVVVRALLNLSITSLWWRVGLMSWISQVPLLGRIPRAAQQLESALPSTGFAAGTAAALTAAALAAGPVLRAEPQVSSPPAPAVASVAPSLDHDDGWADRARRARDGSGRAARRAESDAPEQSASPVQPAEASQADSPPAPPASPLPADRPRADPPSGGGSAEDDLVGDVVQAVQDTLDDAASLTDDLSP